MGYDLDCSKSLKENKYRKYKNRNEKPYEDGLN